MSSCYLALSICHCFLLLYFIVFVIVSCCLCYVFRICSCFIVLSFRSLFVIVSSCSFALVICYCFQLCYFVLYVLLCPVVIFYFHKSFEIHQLHFFNLIIRSFRIDFLPPDLLYTNDFHCSRRYRTLQQWVLALKHSE